MSFSQSLDGDPQDQWDQDDERMSDESEASNTGDHHSESTSNSAKKPRNCSACLSCRRQKTRCEFPEDNGACKLCIRYNRECIKAPPRRRRQKTTVRIADLEQKIQNLTDALIDKGPKVKQPNSSPSREDPQLRPAPTWNGSIDLLPFEAKPEEEDPVPRRPRDTDVIDKGLVDKVSAYAAFERYRTKMAHFFSFMTIPPKITAEQYRRQKPLVFSMIVLAGITTIRPDMPPKLAEDIMKSFGDQVMYRGDRSLELVQCLTLYVCFYSRTLQKKDLNFYQYIHVACTMALDLGLGRRTSKAGNGRLKIPEHERLEARRAWLGCYYMATNAAISLRHPAFVRWSPYIEECLEILSLNPQSAPSDPILCDIIRITRILEDAATVFSMDDPGCVVSLRDPKTQYQLGALEKKLERWRKEAKHDLCEAQSRSLYAATNLYIHEVALHLEHDIDKFRSPPILDDIVQSLDDLDIVPVRIDSLCTCLKSVHELFNIVLELDIDTLRCLPNLFFVRIGYAAVVLDSLSDIFESNAWGNSRSHAIDIKFDYYMNHAIEIFTEVGMDGRSNIAASFAAVLMKIKQAHDKVRVSAAPPMQAKASALPVISSPGVDPSGTVPTRPATYPMQNVSGQANLYNYSQQQTLPTEFNFNDFDTNMFDINAFQTFDPNFNFYDLSGMYVTDTSSASANT